MAYSSPCWRGRSQSVVCGNLDLFAVFLALFEIHIGSYIRNVEWCPLSRPQVNLGKTSDPGFVWPFLAEGKLKAWHCRAGRFVRGKGAFQSPQHTQSGHIDCHLT